MNRTIPVGAALTAAAIAIAAMLWYARTHIPSQWPARPPTAEHPTKVPPVQPVPKPQARAVVEVPATAQPIAPEQVVQAVVAFFGRGNVASFLQVDELARRFVATVDNLGRASAPASLWPVQPARGRFATDKQGGHQPVIAAENAERYRPLVRFAESVNTPQAIDLFVRLYPLLQREFEQLGYPNAYFNTRLLQVIDLLLATPEAASPVPVSLTEVRGTVPSLRPWVRYEYADPALESLASGQKILLRVGPDNARRLKAKLVEIRDEIVRRAPGR